MGNNKRENKRGGRRFEKGNKIGHRFKPGESGNPLGRPPTVKLSEAYRERLAQVDPEDPQGRTFAQIIADMKISQAVAGDHEAAEVIADRTEGRPKQTTDVNATVSATVTDAEITDEEIRKRRQKLLAVVQSDDATAIVVAESEQS